MTVADDARAAAFHCECKLHAFRKTQTGIVVSFILDPADVPPQIALAPLGTRYTLALVERGDDEQPISRDPTSLPESRRLAQDEDDADTVRSRHPPGGAHHVKDPVRSQAGKARYAESDDMQRATIRAAMLMHDEVFQYWVATHSPAKVISEAAADHFIKTRCGIESKRDLASNEAAHEEFRKMETDFAFYTKRLPEVR